MPPPVRGRRHVTLREAEGPDGLITLTCKTPLWEPHPCLPVHMPLQDSPHPPSQQPPRPLRTVARADSQSHGWPGAGYR